jgi:hypothetical protein
VLSSYGDDVREQVLRAAYINSLRNDAVIQNLIARRVVASQGKVPTIGTAAPAAT